MVFASVNAGDSERQLVDPGSHWSRNEVKTNIYLPGFRSKSPYRKRGQSRLHSRPNSVQSECPDDAAVDISRASEASLSSLPATYAVLMERRRIARDLHDHAGQYFVGIALRLAALELDATDQTLRASLHDLRATLSRFGDEL